MVARLCPLRRSLPSQRIATGQTRNTHAECAKRPNASQPRRRSRTHFTAMHTHGFATERRPRIRRIPTAIRWQHEASRIVNPMIPDLAAAVRRLSASQRMHPHMFCSDRTPGPVCARAARREARAAKGRPMRTPKWRFAVGHGRQQPRSLAERQHPSRSSHERLDPIAHCGRPSKRERVGPTPTRHTRQRTHRFIGVKPDLAHALRSGCRHLSPFAPAGRARITRQAWAAHRWAIGIRVLRSTNVNGMCVGPC
jgi:hypothetical protein